MRYSMRVVLCALGALLFAVTGARAQDDVQDILDEVWPDQPRHRPFSDEISLDSPNAAARYLFLFKQLDDRTRKFASCLVVGKLVWEFDIEDAPGTPADLRELLIEQQGWIKSLMDAAAIEQFDLGYVEGLARKIEDDDSRRGYLSNIRGAADVLLADARRLWLDGKHADAADRLRAVFGLARHTSDLPSPLINQLMARSLFRKAWQATTMILAEGQPALPEKQRRELLAVVSAMDAKDPVGRRAGWEACRRSVRQFAGEQLSNGKIGEPLLAMLAIEKGLQIGMAGLFDKIIKGKGELPKQDDVAIRKEVEEAAEEIDDALGDITHEEMAAQLQKIDDFTVRIRRAWEDADAEEKLKAVEKEMNADESGLAEFILVYPRMAQRDWRESVEWAAELKKKLSAPQAEK